MKTLSSLLDAQIHWGQAQVENKKTMLAALKGEQVGAANRFFDFLRQIDSVKIHRTTHINTLIYI